jgi:hypothetical protein
MDRPCNAAGLHLVWHNLEGRDMTIPFGILGVIACILLILLAVYLIRHI